MPYAAGRQGEVKQQHIGGDSGFPSRFVKRWVDHVRAILVDRFHANYVSELQAVESLAQYLQWQPRQREHPVVYDDSSNAHDVRFWGLARCGHHDFADGRSARHRGVCEVVPCRVCAFAIRLTCTCLAGQVCRAAAACEMRYDVCQHAALPCRYGA